MKINLETAEAYFNDRINELINGDVRNGTPFVFISGLIILNNLNNILKFSPSISKDPINGGMVFVTFASSAHCINTPIKLVYDYLPEEYDNIDLFSTLKGLTDNFTLTTQTRIKVNLTHEEDKHFASKVKGKKIIVTLSAKPFLLDIKEAVSKIFTDFKSRSDEDQLKIMQFINSRSLVGYGD